MAKIIPSRRCRNSRYGGATSVVTPRRCSSLGLLLAGDQSFGRCRRIRRSRAEEHSAFDGPCHRVSDLCRPASGGSSTKRYRHAGGHTNVERRDRKSTRLNSSHGYISYAVFCLKKKKKKKKKKNKK